MRQHKYIIAYDIVSNKRRRKVSQLLEDHGTRMNRSVFECIIDRNSFHELRSKLENTIKKSEDSVLFYHQCRTCGAKAVLIGTAAHQEVTEPLIIC